MNNNCNTCKDEFVDITTPLNSEDYYMFRDIVNQGIDAHLEAFTKSEFKPVVGTNRYLFNFHNSEIPILIRRLEEVGSEEALGWASDIENVDNNEDI